MDQSFRPQLRGRRARPVRDLNDLTREFFELATESSQAFMNEAMDLARRAPTLRLPQQRKVCECGCGCFEEPEEPGCCDVDCHAYQGEVALVPIRVVNRSAEAVVFNASVTPWQGAGGDNPKPDLKLDQDNFTLGPNQSTILTATAQIGEQFKPGSRYDAEVVLQSKRCQDRVCLRLDVMARDRTACEIEHAPRRKHRDHCHHWSDHWYCERPHHHREQHA